MYNASLLNSAPCYAPRLSSSPRFATQGFVMYNAALRPSAPRYSPRLSSTPRFSTQRFVMYNALAPLASAYRAAPQFNATICYVQRYERRNLAHSTSTTRNATSRIATRLNPTQRFVCQFIAAPPRVSAHRSTPLRYSTICLLQRLSTRLGFSLRTTAPRRSPQCNATICLSIYRLNAPHGPASRRSSPLFNATLLNDLFISFRASTRSDLARRVAAPRNATQRFVYYFATSRYFSQPNAAWRFSTQRFVCQFIITTRRSALLRHAPRRVSTRRISTQRTET